jgi:hypothetical protein
LIHKYHLNLTEESVSQMMDSFGMDGDKNNQHTQQYQHPTEIKMKPSTSSSSNFNRQSQPNYTTSPLKGCMPGVTSLPPNDTHLLEAPEPPPELEQETLLEAGHRQTVNK